MKYYTVLLIHFALLAGCGSSPHKRDTEHADDDVVWHDVVTKKDEGKPERTGTREVTIVERLDGHSPDAEKLLQRHIEAVGGAKLYRQLKTRKIVGTFQIKGKKIKGQYVSYQKPSNKMSMRMSFPKIGMIEMTSNGTEVWTKNKKTGIQFFKGDEKQRHLFNMNFYGLVDWKKHFPNAKALDKVYVNGRPHHRVVLKRESGGKEIIYLDAKTHLISKKESYWKTKTGDDARETYYEDYRSVDGLKMPYKVISWIQGLETEIRTTSVKHNVRVPQNAFLKP